MKKIPGVAKPPGIFLSTAQLWSGVDECGNQLETWAVNATAFWATNLVDEREFECSVAIGGSEQARSVDIITETDIKLLIIETCAYDDSIHQFLVVQLVGKTRPQTKLEGLIVAAAVAEDEFERVTHVHLPGWALEEGYHTRVEAKLLAGHELTTSVESKFAVKRNVCALKRLVRTVQVAERTPKVKVRVLVEHAEPQYPCRKISKKEAWVVNDIPLKLVVKTAIAVVLARPLEVVALDAAIAQAHIGAEHEIVCFFAVATHFLGI